MTRDDTNDAERDDLMDMMDVAAELHVSRSTVQRYVDRGELEPVPFSDYLQRPKKHFFTPEAVEVLKQRRLAEIAAAKAARGD